MLNLIYSMLHYDKIKQYEKKKSKENTFKKPEGYKNLNASQFK